MNFLADEISRKRKEIAHVSHPDSQYKFIKRSVLTDHLDAIKLGSIPEPIINPLPPNDSNDGNTQEARKEELEKSIFNEENISEKELIRRFRTFNEPIRLFGELMGDRIQRLKKLEGQSKDVRIVKNSLSSQINTQLLNEILGASSQPDSRTQLKRESIKELIRKYEDQFIRIGYRMARYEKEGCLLLIYLYFKRILFEWEDELNGRDLDMKQSEEGKKETGLFRETEENIRPLLRSLKRKELDDKLLSLLADICYWTNRKDYVKANNGYLKMSIGNTCWPLGVGSTGIHGRVSRDKIMTQKISHAMGDEVERKWVQSVKRLITRSQKTNPSDKMAKMA